MFIAVFGLWSIVGAQLSQGGRFARRGGSLVFTFPRFERVLLLRCQRSTACGLAPLRGLVFYLAVGLAESGVGNGFGEVVVFGHAGHV